MIKTNDEKKLVKLNGMQMPVDSFLETFYYKKFARLFVKYEGNLMKAYGETFGSAGSEIERLFGKANAILERPEVQSEIKEYLPEDKELYDVYKSAIRSATPVTIEWAQKLKAAETMLRVKGHLGDEGSQQVTNNVVMVIEK